MSKYLLVTAITKVLKKRNFWFSNSKKTETRVQRLSSISLLQMENSSEEEDIAFSFNTELLLLRLRLGHW